MSTKFGLFSKLYRYHCSFSVLECQGMNEHTNKKKRHNKSINGHTVLVRVRTVLVLLLVPVHDDLVPYDRWFMSLLLRFITTVRINNTSTVQKREHWIGEYSTYQCTGTSTYLYQYKHNTWYFNGTLTRGIFLVPRAFTSKSKNNQFY